MNPPSSIILLIASFPLEQALTWTAQTSSVCAGSWNAQAVQRSTLQGRWPVRNRRVKDARLSTTTKCTTSRTKRTNERHEVDLHLHHFSLHELDYSHFVFAKHSCIDIDWEIFPPALDPSHVLVHGASKRSKKAGERAQRKRAQVESFATALSNLNLSPSSTVVDFGCGTGNLVLPLAHFFPDVEFVAVDMNRNALRVLEQRAKEANLQNLNTQHAKIEDIGERGVLEGRQFQVAMGLHTCGPASDMVMDAALQHGAVFLVSPCCIGKLKTHLDLDALINGSTAPVNSTILTGNGGVASAVPAASEGNGTEAVTRQRAATVTGRGEMGGVLGSGGQRAKGYFGHVVMYPRSRWLRAVWGVSEYKLVAKYADMPYDAPLGLWGDEDAEALQSKDEERRERELRRRRCKTAIELDRLHFATETARYHTHLVTMRGMEGYGKTDLLIGVPEEGVASWTPSVEPSEQAERGGTRSEN